MKELKKSHLANRSRRPATTAVFEAICACSVGSGLQEGLLARKCLNSIVRWPNKEA